LMSLDHSQATLALMEMARCALDREASAPALDFAGRTYSWGEMKKVAAKVRACLAVSGVGPRQPIGLVPRNRPSAVATLLALVAEGRTIQMIYAFQANAALAKNIQRLRPAVVIGAAEDLEGEVAAMLVDEGIAAITIGEMDAAALPGLGKASIAPGPSDPANAEIQILTSGTTGTPKQQPFSYELFHRHVSVTSTASGLALSQVVPTLLMFPLGNIAGMYTMLPTMLAGRPAELLDRFTINGWRDWVVRFRPEYGGLPPAGVQMLLDENYPREDLASIKYMSTGAAPLDPTVHRAFEERYGIPILLSYGATEFGGPVVAMTPALHSQWGAAKLGSVGRVMPGASIKVVHPETGVEVPPGEEGLLEVISPRIGPDWIRTTDIAVIDADGFMFHRGRSDGAIMRGGFKILPETIERALLLHPAIGVAAVVGYHDQRLGQVPAAAVQAKAGMTIPAVSELEAHLRQQLFSTQIPVLWKVVDEMPRTPSMKIDRPGVSRLFEAATTSAAIAVSN
jgi:long-chain acyl-CoA synthetase